MTPPELTHLLRFARAALGTGEWPSASDAVNWPEFIALVERHRVGAFLYTRRPRDGASPWPNAVELRLKTIAGTTLQRAIRQSAEQLRLAKHLQSRGIPPLCVKGIVLAQQLYGGLGRRHVGDIDLLVRPTDALAADEALRNRGLIRSRPDFALTQRQAIAYLLIKPEFEYVAAAANQRVELLWRAEGLPSSVDLWAHSETINVGGHPMATLGAELNALYLFQHGARHGWFRLFWLIDIAQLLGNPGIDWSHVMGLARGHGTERSVLQGAALAADLLNCAVPQALLPQADEQSPIARLVADARDELARSTAIPESTRLWANRLAYRVRLQRSIHGKYAVLRPHLFSPETWRDIPLPDSLFFLYPLATPFAWIRRRMLRRHPSPNAE